MFSYPWSLNQVMQFKGTFAKAQTKLKKVMIWGMENEAKKVMTTT